MRLEAEITDFDLVDTVVNDDAFENAVVEIIEDKLDYAKIADLALKEIERVATMEDVEQTQRYASEIVDELASKHTETAVVLGDMIKTLESRIEYLERPWYVRVRNGFKGFWHNHVAQVVNGPTI